MTFKEYLNHFSSVLEATVLTNENQEEMDLDHGFNKIVDFLNQSKNETTVYLVGNGGSSGIVSHGAIDFLNACKFKSMALTDNSLLTCLANDYGYENVFSQGLSTLMGNKDVLIAISSSGNSQNIINACETAQSKGATVITFSGFKADNRLRSCGHFNFWLNDQHYGHVEIGHSLLLHYITDQLAAQ